jgi:hypothetical protein
MLAQQVMALQTVLQRPKPLYIWAATLPPDFVPQAR